ncbi:MAG: hypothetical protein V7K89_30285 [Nostoc sp.]|uniref:hypothetical protein n=1 Tax=Nostoc sp. TaxID=1180 RepID=UPI002FF65F27
MYSQQKSDRIIAYPYHLESEVYSLHYLVCSMTPGAFYWFDAQVHLQYVLEEFGRTAGLTLLLKYIK